MDERYTNRYDMLEISEAVKRLEDTNIKVCAFGTGEIGTGRGIDFISTFSKKIDFYCDNNPDKWGKIIIDNIECVSLEKLIAERENVVCFLLVGKLVAKDIYLQLKNEGIDWIIPYDDIVMQTYLVDKYLGFTIEQKKEKNNLYCGKNNTDNYENVSEHNDRIAVYTCNIGGYDKYREPSIISKHCDYYYVSDIEPPAHSVYKWINPADIVPASVSSPSMINRYVKIFPDLLFPDYEYSIYLDANVQIVNEIDKYVKRIERSGIAAFKHHTRKSIYQEGAVCGLFGLVDKETVCNQMYDYYKQGMPYEFGMFEMNVIVRKHMSPICKQLMKQWWQELETRCKRDQLSFTYILWKNGFKFDDVGCLGNSIGESTDVVVRMHGN